MRVLSLSESDYANYGHNISKALRSVGVDCIDLCLLKHKFKYDESGVRVNLPTMIDRIKKANIIQVMHSDVKLFDLARKYNPKAEIIVYHTGSRYRQDFAMMNKKFAGCKTITDQTELMKRGNHHYVISPVKIHKPVFKSLLPIRIGHFPSSTEVKGTDDIIKMLRKFSGKFKLVHSTDFVPNKAQIQRMSMCDVYIELFKPTLWGREYGCFGVTALEAASLGKLVITQDLNPSVYIENYGKHPFLLANTPEQFERTITEMLQMSCAQVKELQKENHKRLAENHSFEATGRRVLQIIK